MHVAICDDNVADRKQLERLLDRESDTRLHTTGVLYIDSFGNSDALLRAPMIYDVFFIDMTNSSMNGAEVAAALRNVNVKAPIILCSSTIDYTQMDTLPEDVYHIIKPIATDKLKEMVSLAYDIKSSLEPTIEIRDEKETFYVVPDEIMYVRPDAYLSEITLSDGTTRKMLGTLIDFSYMLEKYPQFAFTGKNAIVNVHYVSSITFRTVVMKNGDKLPLSGAERKKLIETYQTHNI
ncbi:MAG: response regulator transcription factor [Lachnospiraceae bacterium]|nr:response regulator transcription factor [Lachnospiraceae bacterium]